MFGPSRAVTAACLVAVGLLGSGCGVVDSGDVLRTETVGSESFQEPAVDPAVAFLQYDLGISSEEAVRRVELQEIAPRLMALLAAQAPTTFGGLWLDQYRGGVIVVAAAGDGFVEQSIAHRAGYRDVTVERVTYSMRELNRYKLQVDEAADALGMPIGVGVDVMTNRVLVRVPHRDDRAAAIVEGIPKAAVRVEVGTDEAGSTG